MAEREGLLKRLGRGFDRYIGGLLGEDLESMTPQERANARRQVIGAMGRSMTDPNQDALGAVMQGRAQRRAQGELERRTAAAEAEMPRITGRLLGGTAGTLESLPGGEGGPLTARYRQAPQEALGRIYGTQAGRDVAQMAPDLAKLATEGTLGRTVGGSVYNPVTGQFTRPPEAPKPRVPEREVDLGNRVLVYYNDGTTETLPKGAAPRMGGGGGAPGAPPDLSKSERDRIIQIRERMAAQQEGVGGLTEARRLSDLAFEGPMAAFRATTGAALPGAIEPEGAQATIEFDMLLRQQVLPQLKSIFGAAPTEGERKILLELQGTSSLPKAVRNKVIERAIAAAQRRMRLDQQEEEALLSGSYFRTPMLSAPPPAAAPAAPAAPQYIYRNGRLVPAQPR